MTLNGINKFNNWNNIILDSQTKTIKINIELRTSGI